MKLSENTLAVLKNFAGINSSVILNKGNVQRTIHTENQVFVEAKIEDSFPLDKFGIYDLNQFIGTISALNNPELTFENEYVTLDDGDIQIKYYACSPNLIVSPPDNKQLVMTNPEITFKITAAHLSKMLKISNLNNLPNISVLGQDGGLFFKAHDRKVSDSNYALFRIGDYDGKNFIVSFKTLNLRMILDDYNVEIIIGGFSCWTNKNDTLKYFVARETN